VQDRRLAHREGERQVAAEVLELVRDRREDPVIVEAGLADRDDAWVRGQRGDPSPLRLGHLGRVVGMDADGGIEPGVTIDETDGGIA
jgi:hypothetical protein